MNKYPCIIVDDESSARKSLGIWIEKYCPQLELVATAENITQAKELISELKPSIIFLDIEMPRGTGFDLLEQLREVNFEVIFVTAFSQYAIKAFNLSATHYLLKPVDIDELIIAVDKAIESIKEKSSLDRTSILIDNLKLLNTQQRKVVIPLMDGFEVARLSDVLYMIADDNFVHIYLQSGSKLMACRSLKYYEDQLKDAGFLRIHRGHMVNLDHVVRYRKGKYAQVVMVDDQELDIAQSKKAMFLERFG